MTEASEPCVYNVDRDDVLTSVSGAWLAFALENEAPALTREAVCGRVLWDFVTDDATRRLYRALFGRVRATRAEVRVPFRCDSPDVRRFMRLAIAPGQDSGLILSGALVRVERREAVRLIGASGDPAVGVIAMCGWCNRVRVDGGWAEVEDAETRLGIRAGAPLPAVSHGICDACQERVQAAG